MAAAEATQSPRALGEVADAEQSPAALSAEALRAAEASGDRQAELETIAARHFVLSYPQAIAERSVLAERAVELGTSSTTTMGALWGHLWQADLAFQRGDVPAVQQATTEVEGVADRRSSRWRGGMRCDSGPASTSSKVALPRPGPAPAKAGRSLNGLATLR